MTSRFRREVNCGPAGIGGYNDHRRSPTGHNEATTCQKSDGEARGKHARDSCTGSREVIPAHALLRVVFLAPKGRNTIAHGNARGRVTKGTRRPERAK
jgi:hypothetical protein